MDKHKCSKKKCMGFTTGFTTGEQYLCAVALVNVKLAVGGQ